MLTIVNDNHLLFILRDHRKIVQTISVGPWLHSIGLYFMIVACEIIIVTGAVTVDLDG